jgi:peroxiredoxin
LQSRIDEIHAAGAVVLAICKDPVEDNAKIVENLKLDFSILSDPELKVTSAYDLLHREASIDGGDIARPAVFIIDRQGIVRWRALTNNWRVRVRSAAVLEQLGAIP